MPTWPRRRGETGPPDFVGVGTSLSGTRWWRNLLGQHPQIAAPRDGWAQNAFNRFHGQAFVDEDVAAYHALFPRRPGQVAGEWSDRYATQAWVAPLIKRAAPDAKVLMIVRDPVERFRRNLSVQFGGDRAGQPVHMAEAFYRCRYGSQVRALVNLFGADRVLVLQLEACRLDPYAEYQRTLRFLGVDDAFVPRGLADEENDLEDVALPWLRRLRGKRVPVAVDLWPDIETALVRDLALEMETLAELAPEVDLDLWPAFARGPSTRTPVTALPRPSRVSRRRVASVTVAAAAVAGGVAAFTDLL